MESKYVVAVKFSRYSVVVTLERDQMTEKLALAVDLGGSKLAFQLSSADSVLAYATEPTSNFFEKQLTQLYDSLLCEFGQIDVVSLGVPGPVHNGIMGPSFPLKTTSPIDFSPLFLGANKVLIRNDMQMAALAELSLGDGQHYNNFCLVSLSTGIGVGVVINKNVINFRGEMGHHIILHSHETKWQCLNHQNCWASVCSGSAIKANAFEERDYGFIREVNTIAFVNLICAYDPEVIFVMGGVARGLFDRVIPTKVEIEKKMDLISLPDVRLSSLSGEIGVIGAAILARSDQGITR